MHFLHHLFKFFTPGSLSLIYYWREKSGIWKHVVWFWCRLSSQRRSSDLLVFGGEPAVLHSPPTSSPPSPPPPPSPAPPTSSPTPLYPVAPSPPCPLHGLQLECSSQWWPPPGPDQIHQRAPVPPNTRPTKHPSRNNCKWQLSKFNQLPIFHPFTHLSNCETVYFLRIRNIRNMRTLTGSLPPKKRFFHLLKTTFEISGNLLTSPNQNKR